MSKQNQKIHETDSMTKRLIRRGLSNKWQFGTDKSFEYFIFEHTSNTPTVDLLYYTAYIDISQYKTLNFTDTHSITDELNYVVPGGVTYVGNLANDGYPDKFVIGWDYFHSTDIIHWKDSHSFHIYSNKNPTDILVDIKNVCLTLEELIASKK